LTRDSRTQIIPSQMAALAQRTGLPSSRHRRLVCTLVVCLLLSALAAGPLVGLSFAAKIEHCGHVLVGPEGGATGIGDISASGVNCPRARSVFRALIKDKFHPPTGWRFIKGPDGSPLILSSGRARIEGIPYNG
jgi:hypothetical protein